MRDKYDALIKKTRWQVDQLDMRLNEITKTKIFFSEEIIRERALINQSGGTSSVIYPEHALSTLGFVRQCYQQIQKFQEEIDALAQEEKKLKQKRLEQAQQMRMLEKRRARLQESINKTRLRFEEKCLEDLLTARIKG